ncbi:putative acyl-CoA transferase [Pseudomonas aeruginosa]|nr:putative acyl-CoA transferase [Pseudomonas aeruginosa]
MLHTTAEWILSLERAGVPCGPINDLAQVFADPQVQARGLRVELPHPLAGTVPQVASPIRLSETPVEYRNPPPPSASTPTRSSRRSSAWTRPRWKGCATAR